MTIFLNLLYIFKNLIISVGKWALKNLGEIKQVEIHDLRVSLPHHCSSHDYMIFHSILMKGWPNHFQMKKFKINAMTSLGPGVVFFLGYQKRIEKTAENFYMKHVSPLCSPQRAHWTLLHWVFFLRMQFIRIPRLKIS